MLFGTRPEGIKLAPLLSELERRRNRFGRGDAGVRIADTMDTLLSSREQRR